MKNHSNFLAHAQSVAAALLVAASSYGCSPKEKIVYVEVIKEIEVIKEVEVAGASGAAGSAVDSVLNAANTKISVEKGSTELLLTGSLAIDVQSPAVGLTSFGLANSSPTHTIYCTTFEDKPLSCAADVTGGQFSKSCVDFAGKTFGCFLREGSKTLTTIEFGKDASLVAGSGTLKSAIAYDSKTGIAHATVDKDASTALDEDGIAKAMASQGLTTTKLADVTGTWRVTCIDDPASGMYCDPESDPNFTTAVDTTKNFCLASADSSATTTTATATTNAGPTAGSEIYVECSSGGVDVPKGYCFSETVYYDATKLRDVPGYYLCGADLNYCSDPAMASMPECLANKSPAPEVIPSQLYFSQFEDPDSGDVNVALWESKARRDSCVSSTSTEASPSFGMKLGNVSGAPTLYEFDLTSKFIMDGSIDQALNSMILSGSSDHKYIAEKIISMGATRESWRVEQCRDSPYGDSTNSPVATTEVLDPLASPVTYVQSERCKFRLEEFETSTWDDWSSGSPVSKTETYSKFWWDVSEFHKNPNQLWRTDVSGWSLTQESVTCTFDATDGSGNPFCPRYASSTGVYNQYYQMDASGRKSRLMLVCRVGSVDSGWLQRSPAPSDVIATAISTMDGASGCGAVYPSGSSNVLAGLPEVQLEAVRRVAIELSLSKNYEIDQENLCHGVEPDSAWNFNACSGMSYGVAGYQLCWGTHNFSSKLGLTLDSSTGTYYSGCSDSQYGDLNSCTSNAHSNVWAANGYVCSDAYFTDKFACESASHQWTPIFTCSDPIYTDEASCIQSTTSNTWLTGTPAADINSWDSYLYEVCGNLDASVKSFFDSWVSGGKNAADTTASNLIGSCGTYMSSGSSADRLAKQMQMAKQMAMRWEWMPTKAIACGAPLLSTKTSLLEGLNSSCMADASLNMTCDNHGNCMSSLRCNGSGSGGQCYKDGVFIGNIPGRMGFMDLKLRSNGAFELSETKGDRWTQWNSTENKEESCSSTRSTILTSKLAADTSFSSVLKTTEKMKCVSESTGKCDDTSFKTKADCELNAGTWTETQMKGYTGGVTTAAQGATGNATTATNFERALMGDILQKIKFRKCADSSCAEYP